MNRKPNPFDPKRKTTALYHVAIVLDRSGSMESCRDANITGFNDYAERIRHVAEREELRAKITLTVFDDLVQTPLFQRPLSRLHALTRETYVPQNSTALWDAIGGTIDQLEQKGQDIDEGPVLFCILSDGGENSSRKYTQQDVVERTRRLTATGRWTFTYMGANQNLAKVARELGIPIDNTAAYTSDPAGTAQAWDQHAQATARSMRRAATGVTSASDFYRDNTN